MLDAHTGFWDASAENTKNHFGDAFIETFYAFHKNLSPEDYVWPLEKYRKYDEPTMMKDLFEDGYVDMAIFQPTYLTDFYHKGFNTTEQDAVLKDKYPDKFVLNTSFEPRLGEGGLDEFEAKVNKYGSKGVKLYTAEWHDDSKGWKLTDPWALGTSRSARSWA